MVFLDEVVHVSVFEKLNDFVDVVFNWVRASKRSSGILRLFIVSIYRFDCSKGGA